VRFLDDGVVDAEAGVLVLDLADDVFDELPEENAVGNGALAS
jgi:hypothetical protein